MVQLHIRGRRISQFLERASQTSRFDKTLEDATETFLVFSPLNRGGQVRPADHLQGFTSAAVDSRGVPVAGLVLSDDQNPILGNVTQRRVQQIGKP